MSKLQKDFILYFWCLLSSKQNKWLNTQMYESYKLWCRFDQEKDKITSIANVSHLIV